MALPSPRNWTGESRSAIKTELSGKLVFNDTTVFDRLGTDSISAVFVARCADSFSSNSKIVAAISELQSLAKAADSKSIEQLEREVTDEDGSRKKKKRDEPKMYPHLEIIFNHIGDFEGGPYSRKFAPEGNGHLTVEPHTWGFPEVVPDFTLVDGEVTPTKLWRIRSAFAEIKPSSQQGPEPSVPGTVRDIVTQCADYARLHISFCVGIFDRDGITFSPTKHMWNDKETFIRVVRRMTSDLSPVQLGQDPTAIMLPDDSALAKASRAVARSIKLNYVESFPVFCVSVGGDDGRLWCTVGPPIWNSLSFLGRGTSIWRAAEVIKGEVVGSALFVMKSAWRSSKRLAESEIYNSIRGNHPGVAKHYFGADVQFPDGGTISVQALRHTENSALETPKLHRLFLFTLGRPLWEYSTELELLEGLRGALEGHAFLCEQGILHRDISAGNILLSSLDSKGFLTDLEFAQFDSETVVVKTTTRVEPIARHSGSSNFTEAATRTHTKFDVVVPRGAAISGTVQFMASEILAGLMSNQLVTHKAHHDIESFVWVLCYSIIRKFSQTADPAMKKKVKTFFHSTFGRADLSAIRTSRLSREPLLLRQQFESSLSAPMCTLLHSLDEYLWAQQSPNPSRRVYLTHKMIIDELTRTISDIARVS